MLEVHVRLLIRGFMPKFKCHVFLGKEEESEGSADNNDVPTENVGCEQDDQTCIDHNEADLDPILHNVERAYTDDRDYSKFNIMVEDSKTPLYNGCKTEHSTMQVVLSLLHLKASNRRSNKSFTKLLQLLIEILPVCNVLSKTTYQAQQIIYPLGFEIQKVRACRNNCIVVDEKSTLGRQCRVCVGADKVDEHNSMGDLLSSSAGPKIGKMRRACQFDPATDKIYKQQINEQIGH